MLHYKKHDKSGEIMRSNLNYRHSETKKLMHFLQKVYIFLLD